MENSRRNLLSINSCRAELSGEAKEGRPEVSIVCPTFFFSGFAERLAWRRGCPNRSVAGPSGESEGARPSSNSGEEMALDISGDIGGFDIGDAPFIDVAFWDEPGDDEIFQPLRGIGIVLVVIIHPRIHLMTSRTVTQAAMRIKYPIRRKIGL